MTAAGGGGEGRGGGRAEPGAVGAAATASLSGSGRADGAALPCRQGDEPAAAGDRLGIHPADLRHDPPGRHAVSARRGAQPAAPAARSPRGAARRPPPALRPSRPRLQAGSGLKAAGKPKPERVGSSSFQFALGELGWVYWELTAAFVSGGRGVVRGRGSVLADLSLPRNACSLSSSRAKYAVNAIKKKVNDKNPHVALYALEVTSARSPSPVGARSTGQNFPSFPSLPAGLQPAQRSLCPAQQHQGVTWSCLLALAQRHRD